MAAFLAVEDETDRLSYANDVAGSDGGDLGHQSRDGDVEGLDQDVFHWQWFAVRLQAFEIDGDGFTDIGSGVVKRVAFRMATRQSGAGRVIAAVGLGLEDYRVSHGQ
jgi:hypothetical protein